MDALDIFKIQGPLKLKWAQKKFWQRLENSNERAIGSSNCLVGTS